MGFGAFFKSQRIKRGLTLRQFCEEFGFDPGNISKLERDLLPAPQAGEKIKAYAKALGLRPGTDDYLELFDLAVASNKSFVMKNITDTELLKRLPILFRTLDKKDLTEEKLERIINIIKEESGT